MSQAVLRIFSYLPNPRVCKATIAARLLGVEVDVRGAKPAELADWLWDFNAAPLSDADRHTYAACARQARTGFDGSLYKTDAFLAAHPYGTVPAAFSADGTIGIFESNSIMRAVARSAANDAGLYGDSAAAAARIDSFLDVSLIFARDSQRYLLALMHDRLDGDLHAQTDEALAHWLGGIEYALAHGSRYIAGERLSLADICYACELVLLHNDRGARAKLAAFNLEPLSGAALAQRYPYAHAHFEALLAHPAFAPDLAPLMEKITRAGTA